MRFLADMGVSQGVVEWLRSAGHDAIHLRDEGLHRLPNGDIFQKGFIERVVLTFDLDFGEIVAASEGHVVSVVLFRLHNTRTGHVIERLQAVLEQSSTELQSGAIIVVEEAPPCSPTPDRKLRAPRSRCTCFVPDTPVLSVSGDLSD